MRDGEWEAVVHDAHVVIEKAKAAGVYVFGDGIDETVPPMLVSADGTAAEAAIRGCRAQRWLYRARLPPREEAFAWAAHIAKACRRDQEDQELRIFEFDPQRVSTLEKATFSFDCPQL